MSAESTLFVFYNFANPQYWRYDLVSSWKWIGRGTTHPINSAKIYEFDYEEQFIGLTSSLDQMHNYLHGYYTHLMDNGLISGFKITTSYQP